MTTETAKAVEITTFARDKGILFPVVVTPLAYETIIGRSARDGIASADVSTVCLCHRLAEEIRERKGTGPLAFAVTSYVPNHGRRMAAVRLIAETSWTEGTIPTITVSLRSETEHN